MPTSIRLMRTPTTTMLTRTTDADEDADLDEDDDKVEAKDADKDGETAKRLEKVRRTDKRLRERREQDFAKREADLNARESQIAEELKPHLEKLGKFEKAVSRVTVDPASVLLALGLPEDRLEYAAQVIHTFAKAKDDPKARAAVAQLMKDRERDDEIEGLKKKDTDREERERAREQKAAADRELDSYFGKVTKATSDKTPLAKAFIKANPEESRARMEVLAFKLAKEAGTGSLPKERDVVIALEKDRRRILRDLGIDPKTVSASKATAAIQASETKPPKKGEKKPTKPTTKSDEKPSTKDEFIRGITS
jgi:hypothetical protein